MPVLGQSLLSCMKISIFVIQSYPWPPSLWYPTDSSLAGKDVAAPIAPLQRSNELPKVT